MQAPPQENKALMEGTIAYDGTYTVEVSSLPNQIGVEQKPTISSLTGSELKVTNPTATARSARLRIRLAGVPHAWERTGRAPQVQ
jgi:hypothetical protein